MSGGHILHELSAPAFRLPGCDCLPNELGGMRFDCYVCLPHAELRSPRSEEHSGIVVDPVRQELAVAGEAERASSWKGRRIRTDTGD